jgi:hypothetical protein
MISQKSENACVKNVSVKIHRKSLSLAVKLDVVQIDIWKASDLAVSTV